MSVRICVLGSGSRGNSTWVRTEKTRLLVDAGFGRKAAAARLSAVGECLDGCDAILVSHEHQDHIGGLRSLALRLKAPVYISAATRDAIRWDPRITAFEAFAAGETFTIGDVRIHPFSVPHDAADPVAFTFEAEGIRVGVVTDLGYIPEVVKQRVRAIGGVFVPRVIDNQRVAAAVADDVDLPLDKIEIAVVRGVAGERGHGRGR